MQTVEDGQRHGHGHAVERMVRLEAVGKFELAVCGLPEFGELLFGNVRGGVLHQSSRLRNSKRGLSRSAVLSQASKVRISASGKGFRRPFGDTGCLLGLGSSGTVEAAALCSLFCGRGLGRGQRTARFVRYSNARIIHIIDIIV